MMPRREGVAHRRATKMSPHSGRRNFSLYAPLHQLHREKYQPATVYREHAAPRATRRALAADTARHYDDYATIFAHARQKCQVQAAYFIILRVSHYEIGRLASFCASFRYMRYRNARQRRPIVDVVALYRRLMTFNAHEAGHTILAIF